MADIGVEVLRRYGRQPIMPPYPTLNVVRTEAARLQEAAPLGAFTPLRPSLSDEALHVVANTVTGSLQSGGALSISSVSGALTHGNTLTINGANFGTKSLTNQIWDPCNGSNVFTLWNRASPTTSPSNMTYRSTFDGVTLPHSHGTQYLCGRHFDTTGDYNQVWVETDWITPAVYPYWETLHYYWRVHPSWAFSNNSPADNNFKLHTPGFEPLGNGLNNGAPFEPFWYMEFEDGDFTSSNTPGMVIDCSDSGQLGYNCFSAVVGACHSLAPTTHVGYSASGLTNPAAAWCHYKIQIRWDRTGSGWVRMWDAGVKKFDTNGPTDTDTTSDARRRQTYGSYSRSRGANNWRFFKDLYNDRGLDALATVEISSASTYTNRGDTEPQPISSWSDSSIQVTLNDGHFGGLSGRYLYVTDRVGNVNSSGFAL